MSKKGCLAFFPALWQRDLKAYDAKLKEYPSIHPSMHSFIHVTLMSPYSETGSELGTEATKINKAAP